MKNIESQQLAPQIGEVVLYNPDDTIRLEVRMNNETVWLTQAQMAELFQTTRNNITLHISNIFKEGSLNMIQYVRNPYILLPMVKNTKQNYIILM